MRRAAKKDDNHDLVTGPLKKIGFSILETYRLGEDAPDFICAFQGITAVVEVKTQKGKLTGGQKKFGQQWRGLHIVARTYFDVLKAFKIDLF
jgi:Holliday junction resolvase-like predicted endonuclease